MAGDLCQNQGLLWSTFVWSSLYRRQRLACTAQIHFSPAGGSSTGSRSHHTRQRPRQLSLRPSHSNSRGRRSPPHDQTTDACTKCFKQLEDPYTTKGLQPLLAILLILPLIHTLATESILPLNQRSDCPRMSPKITQWRGTDLGKLIAEELNKKIISAKIWYSRARSSMHHWAFLWDIPSCWGRLVEYWDLEWVNIPRGSRIVCEVSVTEQFLSCMNYINGVRLISNQKTILCPFEFQLSLIYLEKSSEKGLEGSLEGCSERRLKTMKNSEQKPFWTIISIGCGEFNRCIFRTTRSLRFSHSVFIIL